MAFYILYSSRFLPVFSNKFWKKQLTFLTVSGIVTVTTEMKISTDDEEDIRNEI